MTGDVGTMFGALADPTRRGVLEAVAMRGPLTATELAAELPVSRQAIVKHLQVLGHAGLVVGSRAGRQHRYQAVPAVLDDMRAWLDDAARRWDRSLERLRRHVDGEPSRPGDHASHVHESID